MAARPTASLVVPFAGPDAELAQLLDRLRGLRTQPGDELIVADNRPIRDSGRDRSHYATDPSQSAPVLVIPAAGIASPGFARNRGAARASGEWLVFIDADTEPAADLLDAYLHRPPTQPETAILAGAIRDTLPPGTGKPRAAARHAVARAQMDALVTAARASFPYAQSANVAIRRDAFEAVGGFNELARAGEDADLCFRLAAAGYGLEIRPQAIVHHRARRTLPALLRQLSQHGAGAAWCDAQHPGSFPPPTARQLAGRLARSAQRAARELRRGEREQACFAAIELAEACAFELGRLKSNRAKPNS
jgi:hypothetical protein